MTAESTEDDKDAGASIEVHRQTCQKCHSIDVRDIIVREPGKPMLIYVRCAKCGELVASYELHRYYHHGKGIESYLRAHGGGAADSGRAWLADFKKLQTDAIAGFQAALAKLQQENKEI
jgi:hypothetical protein